MSKFTQTTPCNACPFLKSMKHGFTIQRLKEFADSGLFSCHKTCEENEESGDYEANADSVVCAGMLIFNEKRNAPNQMMRISERFGDYDRTKLNMKASVR